MIVDLTALWEPGQAYVALSRVRSAEGLFVERWNPESIRAEPLVSAFYDSLAISAERYVPRPHFVSRPLHASPRAESADAPGDDDDHVTRPSLGRIQRAALIKRLVSEQLPLAAMADAAAVKPERVILYLEKFLEDGDTPAIRYLLDAIPEADRIRAAFRKLGTTRLAPVREALGDMHDFLTLRTVRCVMMVEGE